MKMNALQNRSDTFQFTKFSLCTHCRFHTQHLVSVFIQPVPCFYVLPISCLSFCRDQKVRESEWFRPIWESIPLCNCSIIFILRLLDPDRVDCCKLCQGTTHKCNLLSLSLNWKYSTVPSLPYWVDSSISADIPSSFGNLRQFFENNREKGIWFEQIPFNWCFGKEPINVYHSWADVRAELFWHWVSQRPFIFA